MPQAGRICPQGSQGCSTGQQCQTLGTVLRTTNLFPKWCGQSLGCPWDASPTPPPLLPGVTAPTPPHHPHWGTSLESPGTELGVTSHHPPPTQHVHSAQRKQKPEPWGPCQMGTNNACLWNQHILAAPKPRWRPRGLLMPFGHVTSAALAAQLLLPLLRVPGGSRGVPGVCWSRSYLPPFIFQGCSAPRAGLGESHPGTDLSSRRAPRGQRGMSHAWSWLWCSSRDQLIP